MLKIILSKKSRLAMTLLLVITLIAGLTLTGCSQNTAQKEDKTGQNTTQKSLLVYAGAASKPPTEEVAKLFEQKTGIKVDLVFGGSGAVLSQMQLAKKGDLYFPGSSDFMEKAKQGGLVYPETELPHL